MGYYEVPAEVVENIAQLESLMRKALDVLVKTKRCKAKRSN